MFIWNIEFRSIVGSDFLHLDIHVEAEMSQFLIELRVRIQSYIAQHSWRNFLKFSRVASSAFRIARIISYILEFFS